MKELDTHKLAQDTGVVAPVQQQKKFSYIGGANAKKGLILYEVNAITLDVAPATIHVVSGIDKNGKTYTKRNVDAQKNCVYVQALNTKNALRKAEKFIKANRLNPTGNAQ